MSYRFKLVLAVIMSYVVACVAMAWCLQQVTARYEASAEASENLQIDDMLNREVDDLAWHRYAAMVTHLARDIAQDPRTRRLLATGDTSALHAAMQDAARQAAVTSGSIALLDTIAIGDDGATVAASGPRVPAPDDLDIRTLLAQRQGIDRMKIMTVVWISKGRPILTVVHPAGGLHRVGYIAVHADPLQALSQLDVRMGMAVSFWSLDGTTQLASLENWRPALAQQLRLAVSTVKGPDGTALMTARSMPDVARRQATMRSIRYWSFTSLIAILVAIAVVSTWVILALTRRIAAAEANARGKMALDNMADGICMFDSRRRLLMCNDRYAQMYKMAPKLVAIGTEYDTIVAYQTHMGLLKRGSGEVVSHSAGDAADQQPLAGTIDWIDDLSDGRIVFVTRNPLADGGWVSSHRDITERRRFEARIEYLAHYDAATDLPNRNFLRDHLEKTLAAQLGGCHFAVHCLDLDRFKHVNDTLGHPAGDALLKAVGKRLRACVRAGDLVARLGGDEFAIVQRIPDGTGEAATLAARLIADVSAPYDLDAGRVTIGISVGIVTTQQGIIDSETMLKSADLALYRAKQDGGETYRFFEAEMQERVQSRYQMEQDLRGALSNIELQNYYQPQLNITRNEIAGFEALVRWHHPERGLVSPADFVPLAEETGLIVAIGEWVLRQACADAVTWPNNLKVAVNVSPLQFKGGTLVRIVSDALATSGLAPERLELEVTESLLLKDSEAVLAVMRNLRALGVKIALDDFGTGYSSLAYLRQFPFTKIKIDRIFVSDLSKGGSNAVAILRAVSRLGTALGMTITAEGVETPEELETVRLEGCTEMQGYLFGSAEPAEAIRRHFVSRSLATAEPAEMVEVSG